MRDHVMTFKYWFIELFPCGQPDHNAMHAFLTLPINGFRGRLAVFIILFFQFLACKLLNDPQAIIGLNLSVFANLPEMSYRFLQTSCLFVHFVYLATIACPFFHE